LQAIAPFSVLINSSIPAWDNFTFRLWGLTPYSPTVSL
jgi:hypothetical protein